MVRPRSGGGDLLTGGATAGGGAGSGGTGTGGSAPTGCPIDVDEGPLHAFPGVQGYGRDATGARGGDVYEVTNLDSSGSASLGDALSESGRTIVFRVAGTISGDFGVPDDTTIAGQTAPGDGIAIHGSLGIGSNAIVRYLRVRFDGDGDRDAVGARGQNNLIVDHVSASWSSRCSHRHDARKYLNSIDRL